MAAPDINQLKAFFKDATDSEALKAYEWATMAMEFRGLIQIPGTRKRRSDAGQARTTETMVPAMFVPASFDTLRDRIAGHSSLSGLPDESQVAE